VAIQSLKSAIKPYTIYGKYYAYVMIGGSFMKLKKKLNEYNQFKREMEISAQKYGLTNQKTVEFSQKLDLVVNEFMMIQYSEVNKQEQLG
jgi:Spo0E like sporulation regulatory protein